MSKYVDEVQNAVVECTESIKNILKAAKLKFELFMEHKVRASFHDELIKEMFEWAKEGEDGNRVVVF